MKDDLLTPRAPSALAFAGVPLYNIPYIVFVSSFSLCLGAWFNWATLGKDSALLYWAVIWCSSFVWAGTSHANDTWRLAGTDPATIPVIYFVRTEVITA